MKEDDLNNNEIERMFGLNSRHVEFHVPENYFVELSKSIEERTQVSEATDDFFLEQQEEIILRVSHSLVGRKDEFIVPNDYFENAEQQAIQSTKLKGRVISLKRIAVGLAAASCIAAAILYFIPASTNSESNTFKTMLAENPIEETEFLDLLSNEELNQLYLSEIDQNDFELNELAENLSIVEVENSKEKNDGVIKPTDNITTLIPDDITEDDILQYLIEEDSDEIYNY